MNIVSYNGNKVTRSCKDLFTLLKRGEQTAFIGSVNQYENELFLIAYDRIVLARDPGLTWDLATFTVDRFVNVEIVVKN